MRTLRSVCERRSCQLTCAEDGRLELKIALRSKSRPRCVVQSTPVLSYWKEPNAGVETVAKERWWHFAVAMPADFGGPLAKFYDLRQSLTRMWFGERAHKVKLPRNTECQTDIHPFLIRGKAMI